MARNLLSLVGGRGSIGPSAARQFVEGLSTIESLEASALELERAIRQQLSRAGGGLPYRRGGQVVRAAAAGAPPAPHRRRLLGSVGHRVIRRRGLRARQKIRVGTREPYAPALEFGRKKLGRAHRVAGGVALRERRGTGGDVAPHPFMRPALAAAKGAMISSFRETMKVRGVRQLRRAAEKRRAARAAA